MALAGAIPVEFGQVFPDGAYAAGAFEPVRDFDASSGDRFVQSKDKSSGLPLWVVEVIDADPQASREDGQGQDGRAGAADAAVQPKEAWPSRLCRSGQVARVHRDRRRGR